MLTDLECYSISPILQATEPVIISGLELDQLIRNEPGSQIIWGVLSGFRIPAEEIDISFCPRSENSKVWKPDYELQHPQAECELVGWDSSATFFRSKDPDIMRIFSRQFPEAQTLESFNQKES